MSTERVEEIKALIAKMERLLNRPGGFVMRPTKLIEMMKRELAQAEADAAKAR
jgi:hypothetical protein